MAKITTGDLYNEWQLINDKLLTQIDKQDEIITKQQAIIDRFDNPIDTRLTGSIEEYANFGSIALPSNSTHIIVNVRERTVDFRNIDVLLRWDDIPDRFRLGVEYYHNSDSSAIVGSRIEDVRDSSQLLYEDNFRIKSPYFRIIVRNLDEVERTIRFGIITKVR